MLVLITYDVNTETVSGKKRLRKVAKQCENYGRRVQNSVFECILDQAQSVVLKQSLIDMCSEQFLDTLGYGKKYITTDNILSYIDDLNNINNYSIIKIYKIGEKNNVAKYAINLKLPDVEGTIVYNYMIINIDENNRTFSYDGNIEDLSEYAFDDQYDTIENKGSNVF